MSKERYTDANVYYKCSGEARVVSCTSRNLTKTLKTLEGCSWITDIRVDKYDLSLKGEVLKVLGGIKEGVSFTVDSGDILYRSRRYYLRGSGREVALLKSDVERMIEGSVKSNSVYCKEWLKRYNSR